VIILLLLGAGVIVLQIFLSMKESRWPGIILPVISFCISLTIVFGLVHISGPLAITDTTLSTFLFLNISTAVLLIIYAICRGKHKKQRELEKMNAQDME
jgi:membrane protein implicated in regulation of membrane protease activity